MPSKGTVLTVRLTNDAWTNLREACLQGGLTTRSAMEAATELVVLFSLSAEERQKQEPQLAGSVLEDVVRAAWKAVERIDFRHRNGREPRNKVTTRIDSSQLDPLRSVLHQRRLTLNAALSSVFTPWGSGWGSTEAYAVRRELWERAATRARTRDYFRRRPQESAETGGPVFQFRALRPQPAF